MTRTIFTLLIGAAIGVATGNLIAINTYSDSVPLQDRQVAERRPSAVGPLDNAGAAELAAYTRSHQGRQALYGQIITARRSELISMIDNAGQMSPSRERRITLDILLSRYAEIDPQDAIKRARALESDPTLAASLYAVWSDTNLDATLAALRNEPNPNIALTAGVLLTERLGGDDSALLDVIDALPPGVDKLGFEIEFLVAQSAHDPAHAIARANRFSNPLARSRALKRIARSLASVDPASAFSVGGQIYDIGNRRAFQNELMQEWASINPGAAIDYLATLNTSDPDFMYLAGTSVSVLAESHPEEMLKAVDQWPQRIANQARSSAIYAISRQNPERALDIIEDQPPGQLRDKLLNSIARGYGETDIDGAIAWAQSLNPKPSMVYYYIVAGLAAQDVNYAFDVALTLDSPGETTEALRAVLTRSVFQSDPSNIADRVVGLEDQQIRENSLDLITSFWVQNDPASAMNWIVNSLEQLSPRSLDRIARDLAQADPRLAMNVTNQIPADARASWLQTVSRSIAESDPDGALDWIAQYHGQPGYERASLAIAERSAERDPVNAARNIQKITDVNQASTVAQAAGQAWAYRDPLAASQWAEGIQNTHVRDIAVASVAQQWAYQDPDSAGHWVVTFPEGPARDTALTSVVSSMSRERVPDAYLLDAFSNDMARQQAVVRQMRRLAQFDRAAAERLLQKYLTDPTLRFQAERILASANR